MLNALPKDALMQWAANQAADKALELLADGVSIACIGRTPEQLRDEIRYAHRVRKETAADLGTAVHALAERNLRGEEIDLSTLDKAVARRFKHFLTFRSLYTVEPMYVEATVYNDEHKYAGSCDLMALVDGIPTIVDLKTSKGVYSTVALQLAAYRFANYILTDEGKQLPLPEFERGAVLHIRETGHSFREVDVTRERFRNFLHLLYTKRDWINGAEATALMAPIEPNADALWRLRMGT